MTCKQEYITVKKELICDITKCYSAYLKTKGVNIDQDVMQANIFGCLPYNLNVANFIFSDADVESENTVYWCNELHEDYNGWFRDNFHASSASRHTSEPFDLSLQIPDNMINEYLLMATKFHSAFSSFLSSAHIVDAIKKCPTLFFEFKNGSYNDTCPKDILRSRLFSDISVIVARKNNQMKYGAA